MALAAVLSRAAARLLRPPLPPLPLRLRRDLCALPSSSAPSDAEILAEIEPVVHLVKDILHSARYGDGGFLSPEDQKAVVEKVLVHHPRSEDKIGCGVDAIMVDKHPDFRKSRCLFVVRTNGETEDFSYRKCIKEYIKEKYPSQPDDFIQNLFTRRFTQQLNNVSEKDATPSAAAARPKEPGRDFHLKNSIREGRKVHANNTPRGKRRPQALPLLARRDEISPVIFPPSHVEVACKSVTTTNCTHLRCTATALAPRRWPTIKQELNIPHVPNPSTLLGWRERVREKNGSPLPRTSPPNMAILWRPPKEDCRLDQSLGLQTPTSWHHRNCHLGRTARITVTSGHPFASPSPHPEATYRHCTRAAASLPATGCHSPGHAKALPPPAGFPLSSAASPRSTSLPPPPTTAPHSASMSLRRSPLA
uniref:Uncharacterized protein n=1 Tax=Oryza punctata TaxID=4537 RepID=A0A0E0LY97_ORYPU